MLLYCLYYIVYTMLFILYYITYIALFILFVLFVFYYIIILLYYYIIILYYTVFALRGNLKNVGGVSPARKAKPAPRRISGICSGRTRNGGKARMPGLL